jgi:periplasmic protein TonB
MFNQLIESKPKKQKMAGGTLFSIIFHGTLIAVAVVLTARAGIADDKTKAEKITFVEVKKEAPKPKEPPPPPKVVMKAPPPKGFQVLQAPVNIPIKIPDIDLSKKVTNEEDFSGKGVKGGAANGVPGGTPQKLDPNQTYFDFQVEKPVAQIPGTGSPRYPDALRSSGVEGEVQAQFVVDEDGKAEVSSFKVLKATNDLFANAVRAALPNMRFYAAEVGGHKVKQLVQQSFQFKLDR